MTSSRNFFPGLITVFLWKPFPKNAIVPESINLSTVNSTKEKQVAEDCTKNPYETDILHISLSVIAQSNVCREDAVVFVVSQDGTRETVTVSIFCEKESIRAFRHNDKKEMILTHKQISSNSVAVGGEFIGGIAGKDTLGKGPFIVRHICKRAVQSVAPLLYQGMMEKFCTLTGIQLEKIEKKIYMCNV